MQMDVATPVSPLLIEYAQTLETKAAGTVDVYLRILRQLTAWIAARPGSAAAFAPAQLTWTALELYLSELAATGYSISHRARVKAVVSGFACWLIDDKGLLQRNPARQVRVPAQPLLPPRQLSDDQRYVLRTLIERDGTARGAALFALGYWAGCRVSDIAWLLWDETHLTPRTGWVRLGHKGGKTRDLDLHSTVRQPLSYYLQHGGRDPESAYVFTSQRAARLTEAGIHHWFRGVKALATREEWAFIHDVTFHDLRHDFAHRARTAGWSLEEVAYYLGHITTRGTPAIGTTARYMQASREHVKEQLARLGG